MEQLAKLLGRPVEVRAVPLALAYPEKMLKTESVKGLAGLAACFSIVVFLRPTPYLGWPIGAVGLMFLMYFSQQVSRHFLKLRVDDTGVVHDLGRYRKAIRWSELSDLRLNFYPQGKGSATGTLVLILKSRRTRVKVDSSVDHFATLLAKAAGAAREQKLELNPTTTENLAHLGL